MTPAQVLVSPAPGPSLVLACGQCLQQIAGFEGVSPDLAMLVRAAAAATHAHDLPGRRRPAAPPG
jgi:hypothetical protein